MTPIQKDIYKTLAYFSYFDYPLTAFEIFKWQYEPEQINRLTDIIETLQASSWIKDRISNFEGMYAIGSEVVVCGQVIGRKVKYLNAIRKEKKLKRVLSYIKRLPDISGVAICNNLPFHFTGKDSDIDLFVITKKNRVWSSRLFAVGPLMLFGQRPGEAKIDPVDISFFLSEDALHLSNLKIGKNDPYFAYWIKTLTPVHGSDDLWQKFFAANTWADDILPNAGRPIRAYRTRFDCRFRLPEIPISESNAREIQFKKFPADIKNRMNQDSTVVVSNHILKFHKNDRRADVARHFQSRICGL